MPANKTRSAAQSYDWRRSNLIRQVLAGGGVNKLCLSAADISTYIVVGKSEITLLGGCQIAIAADTFYYNLIEDLFVTFNL